ncbi:DUF6790 family protein [Aestuariivirga sp.]|uniref:DUF6790 family protein n=1 Tax=Aestuariivirga sp. TaxID=2650926 RepID=UPI003BADAB59
MAELIRLILSNVPAVMFCAALVLAVSGRRGSFGERLLDLLLLLPVGVGSVWAGIFHVFFPQISAQSIGWQVSPFQFEIGVADLAIGLVAIYAFWSSLPFKAAVVAYTVLFFLGVAIGHVREAVEAGNYAANNFGPLLVVTIAQALLLPPLLWRVWQSRSARPLQ